LTGTKLIHKMLWEEKRDSSATDMHYKEKKIATKFPNFIVLIRFMLLIYCLMEFWTCLKRIDFLHKFLERAPSHCQWGGCTTVHNILSFTQQRAISLFELGW